MNSGAPRSSSRWLVLGTLLVVVLLAVIFLQQGRQRSSDQFARLSNLGKAQLEKGNAKSAVEAFEKALALQPTHPEAQVNLALALYYAGQFASAIAQAQAALERDHNAAAAWYVAGLARLRLGQFEAAVQALTQAKNLDVTISAVQFQLGLAYEGWGRLDDAINEWQTLVQFDADHPAAHYRLSMALRRVGKIPEADAEVEAHQQALAKRGGTPVTLATLEQCRYTVPRLPFQLEPPDKSGVKVAFADATTAAFGAGAQFHGPLGVIDFAHDGRNHLLVGEGAAGFRLLLNTNAVFRPAGNVLPGVPDSKYSRCLVGDLNNDGAPDALCLGDKGVKLFKFTTNGAITDATMFAGLKNIAATDGALVDLDFRGSLDLLAVNPGGAGVRVLRNLGNMYFADRTATSGVPANLTGVRQIAIEDWNHDDIQDALVTRAGQPPLFLTKLRGGPLTPTNSPADWPAGELIALGDLNNDLKPDLAVATAGKLEVVFSDTKNRAAVPLGNFQPAELRLLDYDNDGWLDILIVGNGTKLLRNLGPGSFADVTGPVGLAKAGQDKIDSLALADFDHDGDTDLIVSTEKGGLRFLRNEGGNANLQLKVRLAGRRSNASGLGIRLEITSGGLRLARRVQTLPVEIGVGKHAQLDSVNARWFNTSPTFVDLKVDPRTPLAFEEINIQEGSCPYLYAWDGARFRFVTDILGGAPLGLPLAEGRYIAADTDELAWIGNDANFKPRDGSFVLQITEELREVLYLDEAKLVVADHPVGTEVHSTSKMRPGPPYPKPELVALCNRRPLLQATRGGGTGVPPVSPDTEDVTAALAENDSVFASPPKLRAPQLRGHAEPHGYVLDFGPLDSTRPLVLVLTGWLRLGGGMANIAASEYPGLPFPFPQLEVETAASGWKPLDVVVGAPCGKTKSLVVDLTGKLPPQAKRLRLTEAFELHWDRIALFEKADPAGELALSRGIGVGRVTPGQGTRPTATTSLAGPVPSPGGPSQPHGSGVLRIVTLSPVKTDLHWRGFSELVPLPWNFPLTPEYSRTQPAPVFTVLPAGWCTRYGEVNELVAGRDNALALINAGDELTLQFAAGQLPASPPGTVRDFFLLSSGWDKDADFHVRTGLTVEPLPWHGMDDQSLGRQWRPAFTNDAWMDHYNTRWVGPHFLSRKK
ncbi:MAG: VCBS repeat-containing protein [Verrucomicrobia bacterium]|nr:VCBS repeat-containing protein [Verrucomicrobiota bacterium]